VRHPLGRGGEGDRAQRLPELGGLIAGQGAQEKPLCLGARGGGIPEGGAPGVGQDHDGRSRPARGGRACRHLAIAAEGYRELGEALREAAGARRGFLEVGVAYVRFAVGHRAHFEVMYRPELYHPDDPEISRARAGAAVLLYGTASPDVGQLAAGAAAWSLVHGLATLWLNGNLPEGLGHDPEEITRLVAPHLDIGRH
jgi:hypothetical protein